VLDPGQSPVEPSQDLDVVVSGHGSSSGWGAKNGNGPSDQRADARLGDPQDVRDVRVGQVALVAQEQDLALAVRKDPGNSVEPQPELGPALARPVSRSAPSALEKTRQSPRPTPTVGGDPSRREEQP
jgi:hypothetical protein